MLSRDDCSVITSWVITERSSENVVGVIGLPLNEPEAEAVLFGYTLGAIVGTKVSPLKAGSVVLAYGIGLVGKTALISSFFVGNPVSGRVLEKLGFVKSGCFEQFCLAANESKPSIKMHLSGGM